MWVKETGGCRSAEPPSLPCSPARLVSRREQHGKYTTAGVSNLGLPFQKRSRQVDILGTSQGSGGWRWRHRRLLRGAILPSAGRTLALHPSSPAAGPELRPQPPRAQRPTLEGPQGPCPQGACVEPGIYAAERVVLIKESCFRSHIIGGRQSKQMKGLWWKILIGAGQL